MKFCQSHWDGLRRAIAQRGLSDFVSKDGKEAIEREVGALRGAPQRKANFDPLLGAHWMIVNNAMDLIGKIGGNPLAMMAGDPERPEMECPLCYLNFLSAEHDRTCNEPNCQKVKGQTFDDWIEKAADGMKQVVAGLP